METLTILQRTKKSPSLRFKEFKNEWSKSKLGEIYQINAGGDIRKEYVSPIKTMKFQYPIYANAEKNKGFYGYSNIFTVEAGTVSVAGRGVNIGIAHARNHKYYPIVRLLVLRPKNNENIYFSEYAINRINWCVESTGVPQLTAPQLASYRISIPSFPEQQKIATFLSAVDKKIQQLTRKKELLETYKKGVMQQLFSQEIGFKGQDGKDFPEWEEKRIGQILKIGSGRDYKHLNTGKVPVFGTGGIMTYVDDSLYEGESVGIGRKGTIDKPVFLTGKFWTVDTLFYTHSFKNVVPKFVFSIFQQINWKKHNEASGVPSLSKNTIEKLKVIIPSIEEQQKIAEFLAAIDKKIEAVSQQITKTQSFKKGLIQQMFV